MKKRSINTPTRLAPHAASTADMPELRFTHGLSNIGTISPSPATPSQNHHAPCVDVCPTGASFRDAASGIVDVNPDLCVGCQYCIAACPYRVRFIHPVTKTVDKCDFCRKTNLQAGKLPACVEACPTKALTFGNLDDPNSEISKLLRQKPTYRYKLALGTKPKLYRVPFKYGEVSQ
jgi:protein NrfC